MSRGFLALVSGPNSDKRGVVDISRIVTRDMLKVRDRLAPPTDTSRLPQGSLPEVTGGTTQDLRMGSAKLAHRRPQAPKKRRPLEMYRPVDQAADAPLWGIYDHSTGVLLGQVRGNAVWVNNQAYLLTQSQGGTLADVDRRPL